jgi:hypothetical protein
VKTGKAFYRPNARFEELCQLAGIKGETRHRVGYRRALGTQRPQEDLCDLLLVSAEVPWHVVSKTGYLAPLCRAEAAKDSFSKVRYSWDRRSRSLSRRPWLLDGRWVRP